VATAPIQPLAWEPPYAAEVAQEIATTTKDKKTKKKKKKKKKKKVREGFLGEAAGPSERTSRRSNVFWVLQGESLFPGHEGRGIPRGGEREWEIQLEKSLQARW